MNYTVNKLIDLLSRPISEDLPSADDLARATRAILDKDSPVTMLKLRALLKRTVDAQGIVSRQMLVLAKADIEDEEKAIRELEITLFTLLSVGVRIGMKLKEKGDGS